MDFSRLFHTARYLKPVQIYGRVWFRFYQPKTDQSPAPFMRDVKEVWQPPVWKISSLVGDFRFRFLNEEQQLCSSGDWNNLQWEKLWLYNLHYFDDLNASDADDRTAQHCNLIEKWINENPPGQGNGWEPYPTSLRIVNWIKWSLAGNILSENALQSLAVQVRLLRKQLEIHLLGNHLLANAKALIFAGLFFKGDEAEKWFQEGMQVLLRELPEQVLNDGGHFERSPMYHAIIFEDLLDLINIFKAYGRALPENWIASAEKMLAWMKGLSHPDGGVSFFNDAAFGIAPRLADLEAYAVKLGIAVSLSASAGLSRFDQSGYSRWESTNAVALLDVARIGPDYLPGHAHADTLSFELSVYGQRLFVNSGTSCYGISEERLRQRSTAAHNTVEVDGENSSEVWGGFRVARRAKPENFNVYTDNEEVIVECSHNGYLRLPGKVTHRRRWNCKKNEMIITDTLVGGFSQAKARLYFHPDVNVQKKENNLFTATLASGEKVEISVSGADSSFLENATWHPEFGLSIPNKCLVTQFSGHQLVTKISW